MVVTTTERKAARTRIRRTARDRGWRGGRMVARWRNPEVLQVICVEVLLDSRDTTAVHEFPVITILDER